MQLSLLSLIYFIGFSHAFLLTLALWNQSSNQSSTGVSERILAVITGLLAYKLFEGGITYSSLYQVVPHSLDLIPGTVLWIGPIFYGYIRQIAGKPNFTTSQWLLHLAPALAILVFNSPQMFNSAEEKIQLFMQVHDNSEPTVLSATTIVLLIALKIHLASYLYIAWQSLKRVETSTKNLRSDASVWTLSRIKGFCTTLIVIEIIWALLFLLQQLGVVCALDSVSKTWLLLVALSILSMAFYALKQPKHHFTSQELALLEQIANKPTAEKSQQSGLDEDTTAQLANTVKQALEQEKLFLDDKLSLTTLSEALDIKPHLLSQVINQGMETNFYKLINKYRVEYAINYFKQGMASWSIERIALESGFGNRVTFNKAFKEITGTTASTFRKSLQ